MKIHNHSIEGRFKDDAKMIKTREKYESILEDQMRDKGHVPVVNINTQWFTDYDPENDAYDFILVMYGVYKGKRKAQEIIGWDSQLDKWYTYGEIDKK